MESIIITVIAGLTLIICTGMVCATIQNKTKDVVSSIIENISKIKKE